MCCAESVLERLPLSTSGTSGVVQDGWLGLLQPGGLGLRMMEERDEGALRQGIGRPLVGRDEMTADPLAHCLASLREGQPPVRAPCVPSPGASMTGPDEGKGDLGNREGGCRRRGLGSSSVVPLEQLERWRHTLRADQMLLESLRRDLAADHLGRMHGIPRLRSGGFRWLGLSPGAQLSPIDRLKALGLSELLLRAQEYEARWHPGLVELGYWWLARARIRKALLEL